MPKAPEGFDPWAEIERVVRMAVDCGLSREEIRATVNTTLVCIDAESVETLMRRQRA